MGHGGIKVVSKTTGIAESTIRIGKKELEQGISTKKLPKGLHDVSDEKRAGAGHSTAIRGLFVFIS